MATKKVEERTFKTIHGFELIVKSRKSAIIFEVKEAPKEIYRFEFTFETLSGLLNYIECVSKKSWSNLTPKEANSPGSDYYEYYDRKLDNNGYLKIKNNTLFIERPSEDSNKLYQFNKGRIESFIYDARKVLSKEE